MTNLKAYFAASRLAGSGAWGAGKISSMGISAETSNARSDLAGAAMRSQLTAQAASVAQGLRNVNHTVTVVQNAASNLEAISDALTEMKTLADDAARGALWENEETIAQNRFDALLVEIDRLANHTTDRGANLLAAGSGEITVTLGLGSASAAQTIQIPTFDVTTQGLVLGAALQLKDSDTSSKLAAAIVAVDDARVDLTATLPRMSAALDATGLTSGILSDAGEPVIDADDAEALAASLRLQLIESAGMGISTQDNVLSSKALNLLGIPMTTPRDEAVLPWQISSWV